MGKKVVEGGPVLFKEDLPIETSEIDKPLNIPNIEIANDVFTIFYKDRLFILNRSANEEYVKILNRKYGIQEIESPKQIEDKYFKNNFKEIENVQKEWINKIMPNVDLNNATNNYGQQIKKVVKDKIEELCRVAIRPPKKDIGKFISRKGETTVFSGLEGYERIIILDNKIYDMLTVAEYISNFEKSIEPEFFKSIIKQCENKTPSEICKLISNSVDKIDKKTFHVMKGKIHFDDRTFELFLDGIYFIPEFICKTSETLRNYKVLIEKMIKFEAVEKLIK